MRLLMGHLHDLGERGAAVAGQKFGDDGGLGRSGRGRRAGATSVVCWISSMMVLLGIA